MSGNDPNTGGGRIARPWIKALSQRLFEQQGLIVMEAHGLNMLDEADVIKIAKRHGYIKRQSDE